jgi:imidazolonepropionase
MPVLTEVGLLATPVRTSRQGVLLTIEDAALAWSGDRITWVGARPELPPRFDDGARHSAQGGLVIPGLIDCHTHLAFAGWRAEELEQRALGRTTRDLAESGGGIMKTVRLTREAPPHELLARCRQHLHGIGALGVTTVECKSGYGLDLANELKLLRVYRALERSQPVRIVPTLLGAHVVPPAFAGSRRAYVALVATEMVPAAAAEGLARFCDVFVEEIAFTPDEARTILTAAAAHGMRAKLHADQLTDGRGAALAAELHAVSADHLEHVSADGIAQMARAGVVAVSLPLATLYLREPPMPARALLDAGVPVAVATDFNPGTAPSFHLPLAMFLACTLQRMTPSEVLWGATWAAARALDLDDRGVLEAGYLADFAVVDAGDVDHWLSHFRANACMQTWVGGSRI